MTYSVLAQLCDYMAHVGLNNSHPPFAGDDGGGTCEQSIWLVLLLSADCLGAMNNPYLKHLINKDTVLHGEIDGIYKEPELLTDA